MLQPRDPLPARATPVLPQHVGVGDAVPAAGSDRSEDVPDARVVALRGRGQTAGRAVAILGRMGEATHEAAGLGPSPSSVCVEHERMTAPVRTHRERELAHRCSSVIPTGAWTPRTHEVLWPAPAGFQPSEDQKATASASSVRTIPSRRLVARRVRRSSRLSAESTTEGLAAPADEPACVRDVDETLDRPTAVSEGSGSVQPTAEQSDEACLADVEEELSRQADPHRSRNRRVVHHR
jgi:hypothetical protein